MFRNLVLRLNDDPETEFATAAALAFARGYGSRVTGLYAREPARFVFEGAKEEDERQARTLADFEARARAAEVPYRLEVLTGSVTSVLSRATDTADLIALPRGELDRGAIGTELEVLVKHLPHPFLVASQEVPAIRRIAVAYDGRPGAMRALAAAADLVTTWRPPGLELVLVEVHPHEIEAPGHLASAETYLASYGIPFRTRHLIGEVGQALAEFGEDEDIDLLCMGAYTYSTLRELVAGSVTHGVLRRRRKPVLLCH